MVDRLLTPVLKKPIVEVVPTIGTRPAVMPTVLMHGKPHRLVASLFESIGHIIGPLRLIQCIAPAMEHPDWQLARGDLADMPGVSIAADWGNGCSSGECQSFGHLGSRRRRGLQRPHAIVLTVAAARTYPRSRSRSLPMSTIRLAFIQITTLVSIR
jgi:hypothetical protein